MAERGNFGRIAEDLLSNGGSGILQKLAKGDLAYSESAAAISGIMQAAATERLAEAIEKLGSIKLQAGPNLPEPEEERLPSDSPLVARPWDRLGDSSGQRPTS